MRNFLDERKDFPLVTIEADNSYHRFVCHEIGLRQYEGRLCVSFAGPDVDRMYRGRVVVSDMPTIKDFREMDMASLQVLTGFHILSARLSSKS